MPRGENPVDASNGPVAEFALQLRELRRSAGSPTYRRLAIKALYSPAVLSQAAAGRTVPPWSVTKAYVTACGGNIEDWKVSWEQTQEAQRLHEAVGARTLPREDAEPQFFRELREIREGATGKASPDLDREITVFLMDDHELVRQGVRTLLESTLDFKVVGEASTCAEALVRIPRVRPDVAILDVRLPDGNGVDVCREIRSMLDPPPACLMLTSYPDDDALVGSIMAGAAGYLLKQISGAELVSAVEIVAHGGSMLDAQVAATVMSRLRETTSLLDQQRQKLSPQEGRVLELIADGMTNREIARQLYLAEKTVKNYVSSVLHKLDLTSRTEAALYVEKQAHLRKQ